ncbi:MULTISPECIES: ABC transporter permease [Roseobacteraceae]|uniref:ABC transporter permease n=1 Tax=Roseobacteraceae TaxID=2854170 RepID=UPI00125F794F|nr:MULTISPECIES: ABC transporter permease [Roseobacteraceae]KAB6716082.1 ABC transporter permease [Roseobacter sp. TSBP12]|tara:strand:- start:8543 stop:9478 length:936 start_codon:yes stop_codon:yes gene_type:complete
MDTLAGLIQTAFLAGGVLALAALGEVLAERVGVVNLGVEGLIALGAMSAVATVVITPHPWLGFLVAMGVGLIAGMIFAVATVIIRANQVLCGLALTYMGMGLAATLGKPISGSPVSATFQDIHIPILSDLPFFGRAFFSHSLLVYLIFLVLPVALHILIFHTRHGLNMRAVGENPAAADAAGISVMKMRFWYVSLGSALAAGAGGYLTLVFVPSWSEGVVAGRGWIAVALVIFAGFRPINAVLAGLLFGFVTALGFVGQAHNWPIAASILSMLPYLGTMALMIVPVLAWQRMRRLMAAPDSLTVPYFRDQR